MLLITILKFGKIRNPLIRTVILTKTEILSALTKLSRALSAPGFVWEETSPMLLSSLFSSIFCESFVSPQRPTPFRQSSPGTQRLFIRHTNIKSSSIQ